jgi:hypothetical protein
MDNVRFEITLNGENLCTAGLDGYGSLTVGMNLFVPRPWSQACAQAGVPAGGSAPSITVLGMNQRNASEYGHMVWGGKSLNVGDVITVCVLPQGHYDPPIAAFDDLESATKWNGPAHFRGCLAENLSPEADVDGPAQWDLRFEIHHNGEYACTAGCVRHSMVLVSVEAHTHDPEHAESRRAMGEPAGDRLTMGIHFFDVDRPVRPLEVGDEVLVRVLPSGECDPPQEPRKPGHPEWAKDARAFGQFSRDSER